MPIEQELLCSMEDGCDVEVGRTRAGGFAIKVRDCSRWAENFKDGQAALAALIAVREAGYYVPQHITKKIATDIVQRTFNSGRL